MGWFGDSSNAAEEDPYSKLDPGLRQFLENERPNKQRSSSSDPQPQSKPTAEDVQNDEKPETRTPSESLYQDGRYAHLWKNYKPLREIESAVKSDQEKLMDVLDVYKDRKVQISHVAQENCCNEQIALQDCYESGTFMERLFLCRKQKKAFNRCYLAQTEFLKALGYLSSTARPSSVDEDIQMHADDLYHRMLAEEKATLEAKNLDQSASEDHGVGRLAKRFVGADSATKSPDQANVETLPPLSVELERVMRPAAQIEFRRKLKDITPVEREIKQKARLAEFHAEWEAAESVSRVRRAEAEERKKRLETGKATAGDTVSGWFGW